MNYCPITLITENRKAEIGKIDAFDDTFMIHCYMNKLAKINAFEDIFMIQYYMK